MLFARSLSFSFCDKKKREREVYFVLIRSAQSLLLITTMNNQRFFSFLMSHFWNCEEEGEISGLTLVNYFFLLVEKRRKRKRLQDKKCQQSSCMQRKKKLVFLRFYFANTEIFISLLLPSDAPEKNGNYFFYTGYQHKRKLTAYIHVFISPGLEFLVIFACAYVCTVYM